MKDASFNVSIRDTVCIIQFNEMKIALTYEYDRKMMKL